MYLYRGTHGLCFILCACVCVLVCMYASDMYVCIGNNLYLYSCYVLCVPLS